MSGIEMHHYVARQYAWCKTGVPTPGAGEVAALLYELDATRARLAELEAAGRELVDTIDRADYGEASRSVRDSADEFRAVLGASGLS